MVNIGDRVRIVDFQRNIKNMEALVGQICTVSHVNYDDVIMLEEDKLSYLWLPEWYKVINDEVNISEDELMDCLLK